MPYISSLDNFLLSECTVRVTRTVVGRFVIYKCSKNNLEMVEMAVQNIMDRTPKELQPRSSCPKRILGEWHSEVSFYANPDDVPKSFNVSHKVGFIPNTDDGTAYMDYEQ